jgi:hypothetical protein
MFLSSDDTDTGEERGMNEITATGEPATEFERLIAELSESGLLVFVFGTGRVTTHLTGATRPLLGPGGDTVLNCYVHELYDGQRMRPEKLAAWGALRERYGNRDESRVDRGTLLASAA